MNAPLFILWIGGAPNSGKSAMKDLFAEKGIYNPQKTAVFSKENYKHLPNYEQLKKQKIQHPEKTSALVDVYYRQMQQFVEKAVKEGLSILIEDHAEDHEAVKTIMNEIPQVYEKILVGMGMDDDCFKRQCKKRTERGKENDYPRLLNFTRQFSANWQSNAALFDMALLYFRKGKEAPQLIGCFEKDGETIHDQQAYKQFRRQRHLLPNLSPKTAWTVANTVADNEDYERGMGTLGEKNGEGRCGLLACNTGERIRSIELP